jgi:hypothetical protein
MATQTASVRSFSLPSAPALVGGVYAVCVLGLMAAFATEIALTAVDAFGNDGPVESIITVGIVGSAALLIGVGAGLFCLRTPERARVGAVVLAALAVITLVFFWSGAPGIFGACAAWVAGLTRGGRPLPGAARAAGLVGAFVAALNVVVTVVGTALGFGI